MFNMVRRILLKVRMILFSKTNNTRWSGAPQIAPEEHNLLKLFWTIFFQDNMIDEEKAKKEAAAQMTFEQKINLLNDQVFN